MKFLSIPKSGASWHSPLIYAIDLEDETTEIAHVEVIDASNNTQIATFNLYGVKTTEFDIAPYIKKYVTEEPISNAVGLNVSKAAIVAAVQVNGTTSASAVFYSATLDISQPCLLSTIPNNPKIALGETIHLTIYGTSSVKINVRHNATKIYMRNYSIATNHYPVEFTYRLNSADNGLSSINFDISIDGQNIGCYTYKYVTRESSSQQILWYNNNGGVESYIFPKAERSCYEAIIDRNRVIGKATTWLLSSAYESPEEMAHIENIIFANDIYSCNRGQCQKVELLTRKLLRNAKNLQITIKECDIKGLL